MRIFWCETEPWLRNEAAVRYFCACAGIPTEDFFRHEDLVPHAAGRFLLFWGFHQLMPRSPLPPLRSGVNGKPYFDGGQPAFSISHAGNVAVCAFSSAGIGIDIERIAAVEPELFSILQPEEQIYVHRLPAQSQARAFLEIWTQKESLIKAAGAGVGDILRLESVITPALRWKRRVYGYTLLRFSLLDSAYTVAVSSTEAGPAELIRLQLPQRADQITESFPYGTV